MNLIEIVLLIIGLIIIIISCLIVDKSKNESENRDGNVSTHAYDLTNEDKRLITEKIEAVMADISEEIIVRTDDTLDKLSNEKIMAVNDFSEQILEKIRKNHEEVIFLYSMLEDKEKELKAAVKEIDLSKKKLQSMFELRAKSDSHPSDKANSMVTAMPVQISKLDKQTEALQKLVTTPQKGRSGHANLQTGTQVISDRQISDDMSETESNKSRINNKRILDLYSQGKSILEISKQLELGQGEVKLVIDLSKAKK